MTKKSFVSTLRVVFLLMTLCLLLTGCKCKHEWNPASCTAPQTCSACQITEGEALGHAWADASCEAPKTCSACKVTEGEALGHTWVEATCLAPKTCSVCQKTEASVGHHEWVDATTETPKTCSVCNTTEGERIITDARFTTAACKELFGTWSGIIEVPGSSFVDAGFDGVLQLDYTIIFNNNGTYQEITKLANEEQFNQSVVQYYTDTFYKEFATQGYNQAQADDAMVATYGMNVADYSKKLASAFNWDALFSADIKGIYYVADSKLHSGTTWDGPLSSDNYTISGNFLAIETITQEFPGLTLTRS